MQTTTIPACLALALLFGVPARATDEVMPGPQSAETRVVSPVVAGNIMDHQPFDGNADDSDPDVPTVIGLSPGEQEFRGVLEFDLETIGQRRVRKAELMLVPLG